MELSLFAGATAIATILLSTCVLSSNFTISPKDVTVPLGDTATFFCAVPNSINRNVSWVKGDSLSNAHGFISVEESIKSEDFNRNRFSVERTDNGTNQVYTMSIASVSANDTGSYICAMPFPYNNDTKWEISIAAMLTVIEEDLSPSFQCFTTPERATVGENVSFTCAFNESEAFNLKLTWNKTRSYVSSDARDAFTFGGTRRFSPGQQFSLTWIMKESDNFENFICSTGQEIGCVTTPLQLDPSPIVSHYQEGFLVGSNALFDCNTKINHPPVVNYVWNITHSSQGTILLNSTNERYIFENDGRILVINNLTTSDNGSEVSCQVLNAIGITDSSPILTFHIPGSKIYQNFKLLIIIVCSSLSVVLFLVIIIILVCVLQRKRALPKEKTNKQSQPREGVQIKDRLAPEAQTDNSTEPKRHSSHVYAAMSPAKLDSSYEIEPKAPVYDEPKPPQGEASRGVSAWTDEAGYVHAFPLSQTGTLQLASD